MQDKGCIDCVMTLDHGNTRHPRVVVARRKARCFIKWFIYLFTNIHISILYHCVSHILYTKTRSRACLTHTRTYTANTREYSCMRPHTQAHIDMHICVCARVYVVEFYDWTIYFCRNIIATVMQTPFISLRISVLTRRHLSLENKSAMFPLCS